MAALAFASAASSSRASDFALCDETGQPVATEWLCRLLGGPGAAAPPAAPPTLDEGARAEAAQAALGLAVRVELGVRRMGGQELRAPARRRKPVEGRASRRPSAGDDADADEQGEEEEEGGEDEEDTSNWACCDRCGKWRRLPDGPEYEAGSFALPFFWMAATRGRRHRNFWLRRRRSRATSALVSALSAGRFAGQWFERR